jgi:hypothetical protein
MKEAENRTRSMPTIWRRGRWWFIECKKWKRSQGNRHIGGRGAALIVEDSQRFGLSGLGQSENCGERQHDDLQATFG